MRGGGVVSGGLIGLLDDGAYGGYTSEVYGNYVRATLTGNPVGVIYASRSRFEGIVRDNIEAEPSDPPIDTTTLTISTNSLPSGNIGENYSETLTATMTGGTWPVTWSKTSGTLPAGLTLNDDGTISGSPTAKGTYKFTVTAAIGSTGSITASKEYSVKIEDNQPTYALTVKNTSLAGGTVGKSYSDTLKAELTGAELPATWSYTGTLPPGLTLNTDGTITGTATTAGTFTFTVTAVFGTFTGSKTFTIVISQAYNPTPPLTRQSQHRQSQQPAFRTVLSARNTQQRSQQRAHRLLRGRLQGFRARCHAQVRGRFRALRQLRRLSR